MKHILKNQAKRISNALAAVVAYVALGIGTAHAQTFADANFSIEPGNGASLTVPAAGGLTCSWRETGLFPFQLITYSCDAAVVGALEACVYKNKLVAGTLTRLSIFKTPGATLEGGVVGVVSNNNGRINGTITTAVPVSEGHGGALCTEPALAEVVAVRWCNASLVDTVNNLVGGTSTELFQAFFSGVGAVPSCAELLASP
jgi:hypothetical protein